MIKVLQPSDVTDADDFVGSQVSDMQWSLNGGFLAFIVNDRKAGAV